MPNKVCYLKAKPQDVFEIVEKTIIQEGVVDRLLYRDPQTGQQTVSIEEIPFYKYQRRELLEKIASIDPFSMTSPSRL